MDEDLDEMIAAQEKFLNLWDSKEKPSSEGVGALLRAATALEGMAGTTRLELATSAVTALR